MQHTCALWLDFLPAATITNPLTNVLHGSLLFIFTLLAFKKYKQGIFRFNIVLLFLIFCTGILLGVYLHIIPENDFSIFWRIAGLIVLAQFLLIISTYANVNKTSTSLLQSDRLTQAVVIICLFLELKYQLIPVATFMRDIAWQYLAYILLLQGIILIIKTQGEIRTAFIILMVANLAWPILQKLFYFYGCTDVRYAYFVDIYHIVLTVFSYKLYMACAHGKWVYPKQQ